MSLQADNFLQIIDATPLVSVDLIIKNNKGEVLLGKRNNKPAQHFWFVPGGRIRKNESLDQAVKRIGQVELGLNLERSNARLIGAFDHIYDDNFAEEPGINTHYVALGHEFIIDNADAIIQDAQHAELAWFSIDELLQRDDVHPNTQAYFL